MTTRTVLASVAGLALAAAAAPALATNYTLNWLDQSTPTNFGPVGFGSSVPNGAIYADPNLGLVEIIYSIPTTWFRARNTDPQTQNGTIVTGPDTYTFAAHENFATTNLTPAQTPVQTTGWRITYNFLSGPVVQGNLFLGIAGLGATTSFGGGASTATVGQSGTFLGDWQTGTTYGATQFSGGVGSFAYQNSVTAPGGLNPNWNSALGVTRIDATVSSLTIDFAQLPGDGVGVNIASIPAPAGIAAFGLAGLVATRRRRA